MVIPGQVGNGAVAVGGEVQGSGGGPAVGKDSRRHRWTVRASAQFNRRGRARYERGEGGGVT